MTNPHAEAVVVLRECLLRRIAYGSNTAEFREQNDALQTAIDAMRQGEEFSHKTLYDHRDAVYKACESAGPKLYYALKNLLEAVEERADNMGIESATVSDAHNALLAATLPPAPTGAQT